MTKDIDMKRIYLLLKSVNGTYCVHKGLNWSEKVSIYASNLNITFSQSFVRSQGLQGAPALFGYMTNTIHIIEK